MEKLYFAKKYPDAIIPTKRKEDAGRDFYALDRIHTIVIKPGTVNQIETGIAIAYSDEYFLKVMDKGGYGSINVTATAGVGDSGFRDSYKVFLSNLNKDKYVIISSQDENEIQKSNVFNFNTNKFEYIYPEEYMIACLKELNGQENFMIPDIDKIPTPRYLISKNRCIIKDLKKAITQFVMIPVPSFDETEISYNELLTMKSERGTGMLGSSNK